MQGIAMLLQNRYQRQRLYTRIALGKVESFPSEVDYIAVDCLCLLFAHLETSFNRTRQIICLLDWKFWQAKRMDVVWGETAGVDGQLWLLCPILFTLQVTQNGTILIHDECYKFS